MPTSALPPPASSTLSWQLFFLSLFCTFILLVTPSLSPCLPSACHSSFNAPPPSAAPSPPLPSSPPSRNVAVVVVVIWNSKQQLACMFYCPILPSSVLPSRIQCEKRGNWFSILLLSVDSLFSLLLLIVSGSYTWLSLIFSFVTSTAGSYFKCQHRAFPNPSSSPSTSLSSSLHVLVQIFDFLGGVSPSSDVLWKA